MRRKDIKSVIMEHFMAFPNSKLRVREIERLLRLPLPSVIRYCKELHQDSILDVETIGNIKLYTADRSSLKYIVEKKLHNIRSIYGSGLVEHIKREYNNPVMVLFGSYARGEDNEDSDIDLYIESFSTKKIKLEKYEKILNRNIQVFLHGSIRSIPNKNLANNILNGITLNSYIEVFK
jgi:predicted nucleotidyltransferase